MLCVLENKERHEEIGKIFVCSKGGGGSIVELLLHVVAGTLRHNHAWLSQREPTRKITLVQCTGVGWPANGHRHIGVVGFCLPPLGAKQCLRHNPQGTTWAQQPMGLTDCVGPGSVDPT